MIVAGVMTGTSVDGIDVALVEFKSETDWKLIDAKEKSFYFRNFFGVGYRWCGFQ